MSARVNPPRQVAGGRRRRRRRASTRSLHVVVAAVLAAGIAYGIVATFLVVTSTHHRDDIVVDLGPGEDVLGLPIPLRTVRSIDAVSLQLLRGRRGRNGGRATIAPERGEDHRPRPSPGEGNTSRSAWSWPMIHVVSTRFMQGQGTLVNLAKSRLKLLEVIALPSLMGQTILDPTTMLEVYEGNGWEGAPTDGRRTRGDVPDVYPDPVYIWIIKVDPNLDAGILNELRVMLKPVERFALVIGSNENYGIGTRPGGWRGGEAGTEVLSAFEDGRVYFPIDDDGGGDYNRAYRTMRRAHDARNDRVVLETRLDADDAVNVEYLATLQWRALRALVDRGIGNYNDDREDDDIDEGDREDAEYDRSSRARWLYWCPKTHVQWNPSNSDGASDADPGTLQVLQIPYTCITPGLTLGLAVGTREEDVPRFTHDKLFWEITVATDSRDGAAAREIDCGLYPSTRCAVYIKHPKVSAFRSRALTSAGMNNIETRGKSSVATDDNYTAYASRLWEHTIEDHFGIETARAMEAANFLHANYLGTIKDNLRGQCRHGHSCKISSIEKLLSTIDVLEEESGGVQIDSRGT